MQWFWTALAAPALWGLVNHVDKYIISKYFSGKGVGSLVLFTSLNGLMLTLFFPQISKEALNRRIITQKLFSIILILIGVYFLLV